MFGIPLMFMCLTYTGDLLADAFISGYSKMVNFFYGLICRGRFKSCLTDDTRQSFEQPDVRTFSSHFSHAACLSSLNRKKRAMCPSWPH